MNECMKNNVYWLLKKWWNAWIENRNLNLIKKENKLMNKKKINIVKLSITLKFIWAKYNKLLLISNSILWRLSVSLHLCVQNTSYLHNINVMCHIYIIYKCHNLAMYLDCLVIHFCGVAITRRYSQISFFLCYYDRI